MEVVGVFRMILRWLKDPTSLSKVGAYVHDRDAKTRKLITRIWGKEELLDRNHVTKSFDRKISSIPLLNGIKAKLRRWFLFLLSWDGSVDEKVKHWQNSLLHYQGIHGNCMPHPPSKGPLWIMLPLRVPPTQGKQVATTPDSSATKKPGRPRKSETSQFPKKSYLIQPASRSKENAVQTKGDHQTACITGEIQQDASKESCT
jgi:hypothetical protein